jgi:beta-glucosidase
VTYSADGSGAEGAAAGIVVVGEKPYAEMMGDLKTLKLDPAETAVVRRMKQSGIPVIVVLLSGRPLLIDEVLAEADAVVAAWLPGTEGAGIADVLFGAYKPTGKLSFRWPKADDEMPLQSGKAPLFPVGYGLKY